MERAIVLIGEDGYPIFRAEHAAIDISNVEISGPPDNQLTSYTVKITPREWAAPFLNCPEGN